MMDFPVVCVGGSAGGLDAYIRLLQHLPSNMNAAVIIVNHLRTIETHLHEILPYHTDMPVCMITEGLTVRPNHVYIIRPIVIYMSRKVFSSFGRSRSRGGGRT